MLIKHRGCSEKVETNYGFPGELRLQGNLCVIDRLGGGGCLVAGGMFLDKEETW